MRKYILIFLISLFALWLSNCTTSQSEEFNLKKTLIQLANINEAYLLQSEEDDEFWAITDKMTQALEDNPDWSAKFRKENKYYPYTYDERLGITEEEYNNLFIDGKYISIVDAEVAYPFSCKLIDNDTYSLNLPSIELSFLIDIKKNNILLEDGTILSFSNSVNLDQSENLLGDWSGLTYTYLDVQKNQTGKELSKLGIHDEVFDIGRENWIAPMQAMQVGELDCKFVSITIGKYKGIDEYVIYYRIVDTATYTADFYIFKFS